VRPSNEDGTHLSPHIYVSLLKQHTADMPENLLSLNKEILLVPISNYLEDNGILHKNTHHVLQGLETVKKIRVMPFWKNTRNSKSLKSQKT
jgi:hypothetical protein